MGYRIIDVSLDDLLKTDHGLFLICSRHSQIKFKAVCSEPGRILLN